MFPCLHVSKTKQKKAPKQDSGISRAEPRPHPSSCFPRQRGQERKAEGWLSAGRDAKVCKQLLQRQDVARQNPSRSHNDVTHRQGLVGLGLAAVAGGTCFSTLSSAHAQSPFAVSVVAVSALQPQPRFLLPKSLGCGQPGTVFMAVSINAPITRSSFFKGRVCTRDPGWIINGLIAFL